MGSTWHWVPDDSHPGLRVSASEPRYTLADGTVAVPQCDTHDRDLLQVDDADLPVTLRRRHTLAACPECFGDGGDISPDAVVAVLRDEWREQQPHFKERTPPAETEPLDPRRL